MALRIYTNGLEEWRDELLEALEAQLGKLGTGASNLEILYSDAPSLPGRTVVLYLSDGNTAPDRKTRKGIDRHLAAGRAVIPVLDDLDDAPAKLPSCLQGRNAYAIGTRPRRYGPLIEEIVTRLWLRRPVRKVFLSYKRADSSAAAHQLRDELSRRGYHVFLDECTLALGADVQREIFWWLNDADLVLLLCSPRLRESAWVAQEIASANAMEVPVLGAVWPDAKPPSALFSDQLHSLDSSPFAAPEAAPPARELAEHALEQLLTSIESFRTRAVLRRLQNLVPYVRAGIDPDLHPRDGGALGDLELDDPSAGGTSYLRILPFRVAVDQAHELCQEVQDRYRAASEPIPQKLFLFYPENDPKDPRRTALDWVFHPPRNDGDPSRIRLLSYVGGGATELGELAP